MKRQIDDHSKTRAQLIEEVKMLRQQLARLDQPASQEIERERTENALQESEERFSTTFYTSPVAQSILAQANSEIIIVNDACCRLFGYSREELTGVSTVKLNLWEDPAGRLAAVEELRTTGYLLPREVTIRTKSGSARTGIVSIESSSWKGIPCFITSVHDITERKRAEEALRESEERLRLFIEYAPASLAMFDNKMRYLAASKRWMTDYGLVEQDILERSHYEIFPEIPEAWKEVHRRGLAGEVLRENEDRFVRLDGSVQWLKWEVRPWHLVDGVIGGIVIFTEDITEGKRAEQAILERERQMTALVTSLDDVIFEFDEQGAYLNVWAADERKLAQPKSQLLGRGIEDVLGEEAGRPFTEAVRRVLVEGRTETIEYPLQVIDGQRWFMARISQIVGKHESRRTASMLVRDITERKRAEVKLQESQELFRMLFNLGSVAYSLARASDHRIIDVNPACESLFGYSRAELLGKRTIDFDFWEDPAALQNAAETFSREGRLYDFELACRTKSGGVKWAICYANSIEQAGEKYILSQFVNITERKQRERERETLLALATALRTAPTRDTMIPIILDQIILLMHLDGAAISLLDLTSGEAIIELARGELEATTHLRIPPGEGITGKVIASGQTYVSSDVKSDPRHYRSATVEGKVSAACAPLMAGTKTIGALWIKSASPMQDAELRLLEGIANMAATAIHRATLFEQTVQYASQLTEAYEKNIEGWSRALDLRDKETEGHTLRVTSLTVELARALGIPEAEVVHARRGALLHDIGKMGVPDHILLKPGALTEEEWVEMRKHPVFAHELLSPIEFLHDALDIPYCHHEKWNGKGYPRGLKGEEIPLAARIFAVVDVWDALTSDRPYHKARSKEMALAYIQEQTGTHFDPRIVEMFVQLLRRNGQEAA